MKEFIQLGASPRATINRTLAAKAYAFLEGRGYVTPQDVKSIGMDVLRHRVAITYDPEAAKKSLVPENKPRLEKLGDAFAAAAPFNTATLEAALKAVAAELGVKAGALVHPVRLACTGNPSGPNLYHLLEVMGKEKVMGRIERAIQSLCKASWSRTAIVRL